MPAPRSPAQIEASRRNGARSRGPVTAEGKARASRNALKHGLTAMQHLVLEDEDPSELEEMTARLMVEVAPMSEIEARIARRLAIAFWKGERAERIEVALFDAAPKLRPPQAGYQWEQADPLTTFDLKRFNAVRGYQAQQGREISRCLKKLRALRKDGLADCTDEPEDTAAATLRNEPESLPEPANDHAPQTATGASHPAEATLRNEPGPPTAHGEFWEIDGVPLLHVWGQPRRHPLAAARIQAPALRSSWTTRRVAVQRVTAPGPLAVIGVAAELPFPVHPTMLRHACGFALAEPRAADGPALLNRVSSSSGVATIGNSAVSTMAWDCRRVIALGNYRTPAFAARSFDAERTGSLWSSATIPLQARRDGHCCAGALPPCCR